MSNYKNEYEIFKELLISRKLPVIEDYNIESLHNLTKFR